MKNAKKTIAIAGATGFVGTELIDMLIEKHEIIGLTRSKEKISNSNLNENVKWVSCDAFSLLSVNSVLKNVDCLIYLIHSMLPSSRLSQGTFRDLDLLIADNFSNGVRYNNVKQIIYISGLMPKEDKISNTSSLLIAENFLSPTSST